jgi:hypothetical protein
VLLCGGALELLGCSPLCWTFSRAAAVPEAGSRGEGSYGVIEAKGYEWIQETWRKDGEEGMVHRVSYEQIWAEWVARYVSFLEDALRDFFAE